MYKWRLHKNMKGESTAAHLAIPNQGRYRNLIRNTSSWYLLTYRKHHWACGGWLVPLAQGMWKPLQNPWRKTCYCSPAAIFFASLWWIFDLPLPVLKPAVASLREISNAVAKGQWCDGSFQARRNACHAIKGTRSAPAICTSALSLSLWD